MLANANSNFFLLFVRLFGFFFSFLFFRETEISSVLLENQ